MPSETNAAESVGPSVKDNHDERGLFKPRRHARLQKGQSGNPGGKPTQLKDVVELARSYAPQAITQLVRQGWIAAPIRIMRALTTAVTAATASRHSSSDTIWDAPA